jgi:hypothetical protein
MTPSAAVTAVVEEGYDPNRSSRSRVSDKALNAAIIERDPAELEAVFRGIRGELTPEQRQGVARGVGYGPKHGHTGPGRQGTSADWYEVEDVSRRLNYLFSSDYLTLTLADVANMTKLGQATVSEVYNLDRSQGKISESLQLIHAVLDRLNVPREPGAATQARQLTENPAK